MNDFFYITLIYFLFSFFLIYPPNEVISLGLTIPHLLSGLLGNEHTRFVEYHMARILLTLCVHSLLPLVYYLLLITYTQLDELTLAWKIFYKASILLPIGVFSITFLWFKNGFKNYPIVNRLSKLARDVNQPTWLAIANQINSQFMSIDKFSSGSLYNRTYVTQNWILKVSLYNLKVIRQENAQLKVTQVHEYHLSQDSNINSQYLTIQIKDSSNETFEVRLNAFEYKDFKEKISTSIEEPASISIKQTIQEQFLDVFKEEISKNKRYECGRDQVDVCAGCMRQMANVKLIKACDEPTRGECRQCNCRPMWCMDCVGKWFAYRQNPNEPNTWLSSKCTCATCRAVFCVLDVQLIEFIN